MTKMRFQITMERGMTICSENLENQLRQVLATEESASRIEPGKRTPAAVLVPFVCLDGHWHLLFTKRTNGVAKHRGEISFPGGAVEVDDDDQIQTALRETLEEIGVPKEKIKVIGAIEPVPTISNFCVLPVVGIMEWPLSLNVNQDEVEKIILIPVDWLSNAENWYESDYEYEPGTFRRLIHYQDYNGEHLWGLTALMTRKVLDLL